MRTMLIVAASFQFDRQTACLLRHRHFLYAGMVSTGTFSIQTFFLWIVSNNYLSCLFHLSSLILCFTVCPQTVEASSGRDERDSYHVTTVIFRGNPWVSSTFTEAPGDLFTCSPHKVKRGITHFFLPRLN